MELQAGYVYVLINPSLNGMVKIGKTQNNPDERAKELSSVTGVPTPFFVAYSAHFKDCNAAEIFVHTRLENNRLADNREFFHISVQKAIEAVREAESILGIIPESEISLDLESRESSTEPLRPWEVIFRSANAHFYGADDTIEDYYEAFQLYLKSAKLGSISAYWKLGIMNLMGWGCKQDIQKAKSVFLDGTKLGNDLCWAGLADVYYREGHFENWDKCWRKYFSSSFFRDGKQFDEYEAMDVMMSHRAYQMCFYINQSVMNKWKMSQEDLIYEQRGQIGAFIMWYRTNSANDEAYLLVDDAITKLTEERINKS